MQKKREKKDRRTLHNTQSSDGLALGILVRVDRRLALDQDHGPLLERQVEITGVGAGGEDGDVEPAGLLVLARPAVGGYGVAEVLFAVVAGAEVGGVGEVADDGDFGIGALGGGGEGTGSSHLGAGGSAGDGAEEGRHVGLWLVTGLI